MVVEEENEAFKGMQEVVVEEHGQYNKALDMQLQVGGEVSHAQEGSGGGGEYTPRQMVAGKSSEKTDRLRLDLEMEGNIKEESVEKVTTLRDLLVKESMEMRVWGMGTGLKRPKRRSDGAESASQRRFWEG